MNNFFGVLKNWLFLLYYSLSYILTVFVYFLRTCCKMTVAVESDAKCQLKLKTSTISMKL